MDVKQLRIVYMGTPDFAVGPLKQLVDNGYQIVAVVTMPDKPAGRGLKMQESAVKRYASEAGIPVLQPEKLKDPEFVHQFEQLNADLGIVIAFRMLPEVIWSMPKLGTFNLHASLLPDYRGAAPINWALINGDTQSGVTTFMLNREIDKGDILGQKTVPITPDDNAGSLHDKLMAVGAELVRETIDMIAEGKPPIPQPQADHFRPAPKIFKETCRIDWSKSTSEIINLIRGLSPYPAAWSELCAGSEKISVKIYAAHVMSQENASHEPGTIITDGRNSLAVCCKDGIIRIDELQLAGKKRLKTADLLRGFGNIGQYRFE